MSRFAPLNRYCIIIDEVFFDNFLLIIYLLAVYKKKMSPSHLGTWLCEGGGHESEAAVSGKLV